MHQLHWKTTLNSPVGTYYLVGSLPWWESWALHQNLNASDCIALQYPDELLRANHLHAPCMGGLQCATPPSLLPVCREFEYFRTARKGKMLPSCTLNSSRKALRSISQPFLPSHLKTEKNMKLLPSWGSDWSLRPETWPPLMIGGTSLTDRAS